MNMMMVTKNDGHFLVGFGERIRDMALWEDDEGSVERCS